MKRNVFFAVFLCLILSFCACSPKASGETAPGRLDGQVSLETYGEDGSPVPESGPEGKDIQAEAHESPVYLLKEYNGGSIAVSPDGYYEVYSHGNGGANLLYTDIATAQRIYLSPNVSANHQSAADPSWLDEAAAKGGVTVFVAGDALLFANTGIDEPGALYKAGLDGSGRRVLAVFEDYRVEWFSGDIAFDGTNLYVTAVNRDGKQVLLSINSEDGAFTELYTLPEEGALLYGAFDDCLLFKTFKEPEGRESMDDQERYNNLTAVVFTYSLSSGEVKEVLSWTQVDMFDCVFENRLYGFDVANDCLKVFNLSDGSEEVLLASLSENNIHGAGISSVERVWDGHIIYSCDGDTYNLDLETFKAAKMKLLDNYKPSVIIGEFGDDYLVTGGDLIIPYEGKDPAGRDVIMEVYVNQLVLINKEDYWNSAFNFKPVTNTFFEE